jgi:uncharacterized Zn-binding protein involved in type VI secretion
MGKPAARIGDLAGHGGAITLGSFNVFTGKKPQARLLDMVTCPCPCTGVINLGSFTVFVNCMPAARIGDQTLTAGIHPPVPGAVSLGEFMVYIGG